MRAYAPKYYPIRIEYYSILAKNSTLICVCAIFVVNLHSNLVRYEKESIYLSALLVVPDVGTSARFGPSG